MSKPTYTIELYTVNVDNNQFNFITEITRYESLNFSRKNNNVGTATITFNVYDSQFTENLFVLYRTKVLIKRNNVPVWVGFVYKKRINYSTSESLFTIICYDYLKYLDNRYLKEIKEYLNTQFGNIAWDLIDTMQGEARGEYMIRQGLTDTTTVGNRQYNKYSQISTLIKNLSNVRNGIDFDFRPQVDSDGRLEQVNFDVWQNRGSLKESFVIEKGVIESINATTFVTVTNNVTAIGFGTGEEIPNELENNAPLEKSYTKLELIFEAKNTIDQKILEEKALDILDKESIERYNFNVTLIPNKVSYNLFDLNDILRYDFTGFNSAIIREIGKGTARIREINYNISQNGTERISPYLELNS